MPLTPEDVVRKSFRSKLRGYDPGEVDAFLEEVVFELRRFESEVDELRAKTLAQGGTSPGQHQLSVEQKQLELVRKERADLVADMAALQKRYDGLRAQVSELEDRKV